MIRYIGRRLLRAIITLVVFQTILFLLIHSLPQDIASLTRAPEVYRTAMRHNLGLDLPLWQQYFIWMRNFFSGNLGNSFVERTVPVTTMFLARMPRTLLLFLPATVIGFGLGLWLGKQVAWRRGGWLEFALTLGGASFYTSFAPWLAFVLVNIFALGLQWTPPENMVDPNVWAGSGIVAEQVAGWMLLAFVITSGLLILLWYVTSRYDPSQRLAWRVSGTVLLVVLTLGLWANSGWSKYALDILRHLVLPLSTLVLLSFGETMLLMRTTMMEVLGEDHVKVARAKGVSDSTIRDRHVARIAILPVLARFVVQLPLVIIGSFILERIFFWGGMGEMLFRAVDFYDMPVLLGTLSMVGVVMLLAHIFLDILCAWLDPRLRTEDLMP